LQVCLRRRMRWDDRGFVRLDIGLVWPKICECVSWLPCFLFSIPGKSGGIDWHFG
jgi:hypothetical protein